MTKKILAALAASVLIAGSTIAQAQTEIRWGTSRVGSSGHRALVNLAEVLKREMPNYQFTVQPTPGAIVSVKGYATGQMEGYYGSDVAFYELANGIKRFKGFKENMQREPVQSMWNFTVEVGLAIHARDREKIKSWSDLKGMRLFTGPRPWDTRAQMERALEALGIDFEYIEVDIGTAGSLLDAGRFAGMTVYANAESATAPWITEAGLAVDWAALNPSDDEKAKLEAAGFRMVNVKNSVFKENIHADHIVLLPFYYGFHVGLEVPEEDVYKMLVAVEKNADALAQADKGFTQIKNDMVGMQRRGIESAVNLVRIHPGLARYMRERNAWNSAWDARVATK
ncbi:MAG: TRAP transporter substrate-binding protein [Ectothiorhodospiraceae bacterium]|nr:TRAP transporter substrate-binding protein [Ectothiorhodospiraceae bacterium]